MTAKTFHNLSKISQWPQMQMPSRDEGERKRLRKRERGRAGEIAKEREREPVYRLVSSWSGVNCE